MLTFNLIFATNNRQDLTKHHYNFRWAEVMPEEVRKFLGLEILMKHRQKDQQRE